MFLRTTAAIVWLVLILGICGQYYYPTHNHFMAAPPPPAVTEIRRPRQATLVIVFDTTWSNVDDLGVLRNGAEFVVRETAKKRPIYNYVLAPVDDPYVDGPVMNTLNSIEIIDQLQTVPIYGGCGCSVVSLVSQALESALSHSYVYVFTSAETNDDFLLPHIHRELHRKRTSISFIIVDRTCRDQPPRFRSYKRLAKATNGEVLCVKSRNTSVPQLPAPSPQFPSYPGQTPLSPQQPPHHPPQQTPREPPQQFPSYPGQTPLSPQQPPHYPPQQTTQQPPRQFPSYSGQTPLPPQQSPHHPPQQTPSPPRQEVPLPQQQTPPPPQNGLPKSDDGAQILDEITSNQAANHTIPVAVDDNLNDFSISIVGGGATIVVHNPNNEVSKKAKETVNTSNMRTVKVHRPEPGEWTIAAGSSTAHTIKVLGISGVSFNYGFSLHRPVALAETNRRPILGNPNFFSVSCSDPLAVASLHAVRFFAPTFEFALPLQPVKYSPLFVVAFQPPPFIFKIEIKGKDNSGNAFKRLLPAAVAPVNVTKPQYLGSALEQFLNVPRDEDLDLDCIMIGEPTPRITWYKDGVKLTDTSATLILSKGETEKTDYMCVGENDGGTANVTFHVNPSNPPEVIDWLMKYQNGSTVTLDEDTQGFLNCPVRGVPDPNVTWTKDGLPLQNDSSVDIAGNGMTIKFKNVQRNVTGLYNCVAENADGSINLSYNVTINEPPTFVDVEQQVKYYDPEMETYVEQIVAKANDTITLECNVQGTPMPDVFWFHEVNPRDAERELVQSVGSQLTVSVQNETVYYCAANNSVGTLEKQFQIKMPGLPKLKVTEDQRLTVPPNGLFTMTCDVQEDMPGLDIMWYKDGAPTPVTAQFKVFLDGKILKVVNATEAEMGQYECVVSNEVGSVTKRFDVNLVAETVWTPWSEWTPCNCDSKQQFRSRRCQFLNGTATRNDEHRCSGGGVEMRNCAEDCDTERKGWSEWASWSPCSASCGPGYRSRSRSCQSDDTSKCVGAALEKTQCEEQECTSEVPPADTDDTDCKSGFFFDIEQESCMDVDECEGDNTCNYSQLCVNEVGSYACICPEGFVRTGFGKRCLDINECSKMVHKCSHNCVNTRGSYRCQCPDDMKLTDDRMTCIALE